MRTPDRALPAGAPADLQPATDASGPRTGGSGAGASPGTRRAGPTVRPEGSRFPFGPGDMGNPHRNTEESFSRIFGMILPAPGGGRASAALQGRPLGRFSPPRPAASVSTPFRRPAPCRRLIGPVPPVARGPAPGSAGVTASRRSRGHHPPANGATHPADGQPRPRRTGRAVRPPLSSQTKDPRRGLFGIPVRISHAIGTYEKSAALQAHGAVSTSCAWYHKAR